MGHCQITLNLSQRVCGQQPKREQLTVLLSALVGIWLRAYLNSEQLTGVINSLKHKLPSGCVSSGHFQSDYDSVCELLNHRKVGLEVI